MMMHRGLSRRGDKAVRQERIQYTDSTKTVRQYWPDLSGLIV